MWKAHFNPKPFTNPPVFLSIDLLKTSNDYPTFIPTLASARTPFSLTYSNRFPNRIFGWINSMVFWNLPSHILLLILLWSSKRGRDLRVIAAGGMREIAEFVFLWKLSLFTLSHRVPHPPSLITEQDKIPILFAPNTMNLEKFFSVESASFLFWRWGQ